jgi:hypothetical protein
MQGRECAKEKESERGCVTVGECGTEREWVGKSACGRESLSGKVSW